MEHIRIIAPGDPGFDWLYDLYMQSFPVHEQRLREREQLQWLQQSSLAFSVSQASRRLQFF